MAAANGIIQTYAIAEPDTHRPADDGCPLGIAPDLMTPPVVEDNRRNPIGWVVFSCLVLIVMALSWFGGTHVKAGRFDDFDEEQQTLKRVMSAESLQKTLKTDTGAAAITADESLATSLNDPISGLVLQADKDPVAATLYSEMRTFQKEPVPVNHLVALQHSKFPQDRAIAAIYAAPKLTLDQANQLIAQLPKEPFAYQAARVQALEKAGDTKALQQLISPYSVVGFGIIMLFAWPCLGISFAVWLILMRRIRENRLDAKGIPLDQVSPFDADRLAIRGAQIFFGFFLLDLVADLVNIGLHLKLSELQTSAIAGMMTIVLVVFIQRLPVLGKEIRLEYLGVQVKNLKQDILLGIIGFMAEFPVAMFLAELSTMLLRWLPKATHPASEALMKSHSLGTLVPVFIAGSIVAPFWEEIVFRGMLFPGLKRLLGGMVPAMLLSSFMFAAVHSQGITMWLPLTFVGASSCFLSYQSRSLVPGMVMHFLHNTAIFVMILLT